MNMAHALRCPRSVIRLIVQFLQEHNLVNSLQTLQVSTAYMLKRCLRIPHFENDCYPQEESQVTLNTVDNVEKFIEDILHGRMWQAELLVSGRVLSMMTLTASSSGWDSVLEVATSLRLKSDVLVDLFEQVLVRMFSLCLVHQLMTARASSDCD